jgi:signal transduction histidine kinase
MQPEERVNILLVDDRSENLLALEAILEPLGHNLVRATSGREALKCLLGQDFAVILLDVQMPGIDGFETATLIRGRERSENTPIIFLTAVNNTEAHVFRGYAVGAVDYLLKPIVPEILLSKVAVFVDLHKKTATTHRQAAELGSTVRALEHEIEQRQEIEDALRRAHDELGQRVRERTANLAAMNEVLQQEIAERKRVEAERAALLQREQHARTAAEKAVQLRDQFLSVASHELKTPLTALLGYLHLLQRRVERAASPDPRDQQAVQVVMSQAARLNRLIDALLDISRIQNGQLSIVLETLDLNGLVRRVLAELKPTLQRHTIEHTSAEVPLLVQGDELRLEQVLYNLIQNAMKYSPNGGKITIQAVCDEQEICLSVADRGIGIPAAALPHLFDRFYRAENADMSQFNGMGIGLYVVQEIVSLHGGTIRVASVEGEGSTFTIALPLAAPAVQAEYR